MIFPAARLLLWLMPLPLAIPTYIAAYVYADLFDRSAWSIARWRSGFRCATQCARFPIALAAGRDLRHRPVLYPYVYLSARAMFQSRAREFAEAARTLGASRWHVF